MVCSRCHTAATTVYLHISSPRTEAVCTFGGRSLLLQPLVGTNPLSVSIKIPRLSTWLIGGLEGHAVLCDGALSPRAALSRLQPALEAQHPVVRRTLVLSFRWSSDGHPGGLHLWDVEDRVTTNPHVRVFVWGSH